MRRREGRAVPEPTFAAVTAATEPRPGRRPAARALLSALLILLLSSAAFAHATAGQQRALLDLRVNGTARGVGLVIVRGAELWVEVESLTRAELQLPDGERETIDGRLFVRLASLAPRITFSLDEAALTLSLTAAPDLLGRRVVQMRAPRPAGIEYRRDTSGFVNYGVNWTRAPRGRSASRAASGSARRS